MATSGTDSTVVLAWSRKELRCVLGTALAFLAWWETMFKIAG